MKEIIDSVVALVNAISTMPDNKLYVVAGIVILTVVYLIIKEFKKQPTNTYNNFTFIEGKQKK